MWRNLIIKQVGCAEEVPNVDSFNKIFWVLGTVPGTENITTGKIDKNPCPGGAYILVKATDNKHIHVYEICLGVISAKKNTAGQEVEDGVQMKHLSWGHHSDVWAEAERREGVSPAPTGKDCSGKRKCRSPNLQGGSEFVAFEEQAGSRCGWGSWSPQETEAMKSG